MRSIIFPNCTLSDMLLVWFQALGGGKEEEVGAGVEDWRGIGGRGDKYELHNGTKVRFLGLSGCSFLI